VTEFEQWLATEPAMIDENARLAAENHQLQLTKPRGSLGQLENIAIQLAGMQATSHPKANKVHITIFAADHGIVEEGISTFPQSVTAQMIHNFSTGGAAISVMAKEVNASLSVINMGTVDALVPLDGVDDQRISAGTHNFCQQAAMSLEQCEQALLVGKTHIQQLKQQGIEIFIGGEMGIGNTTSASALAASILNINAHKITGPGTGLDADGVHKKATLIQSAIDFHQAHLNSPLSILQFLGGFEIAALVGSYLECGKQGLPVIIDGFISTVAALLAERLCPKTKNWFLYSHRSAEPSHRLVVQALAAEPLLDIGMRLGEASGAASVLPLIRLSCALHNNMATFEQAAVEQGVH
jgi:nicotinate-nucleotide--dimethylbenzimidazole phosphoribosyltransferase